MEAAAASAATKGGSLSSHSSSSGCSSAGCCSSVAAGRSQEPAAGRAVDSPPAASPGAGSRTPRAACRPAVSPISQFSAFSFRRELGAALADTDSAAGRARRRRASMSQPASEPADCCCRLCCAECGQRRRRLLARRPPEPKPGETLRWRRATIVGRPPPAPPAGPARATVAPLAAKGSTWSRQRARRSLAVPPPVVPLDKELALLGPPGAKVVSILAASASGTSGSRTSGPGGSTTDGRGHQRDNNNNNNWRRCVNSNQDGRELSRSGGAEGSLGAPTPQPPRPGEGRPAGSSGTLGRRTGRFLERLRQGFLANFGQPVGANIPPKSGQYFDSGPAAAESPKEAGPIYDTPELVAGAARARSGRPALPPPPPPPPPPLSARRSLGATAIATNCPLAAAARAHAVATCSDGSSAAPAMQQYCQAKARARQGQGQEEEEASGSGAGEPHEPHELDERPATAGARKAVKWAEQDDGPQLGCRQSALQPSQTIAGLAPRAISATGGDTRNRLGEAGGGRKGILVAAPMGAHHSSTAPAHRPTSPSPGEARAEPSRARSPAIKAAPDTGRPATNGQAAGKQRPAALQLVRSKLLDLPGLRPSGASPGGQVEAARAESGADASELAKSLAGGRSAPPAAPMDPLERRRKSIRDGDVFIYPSHYKDQNVCHRCERDNRICSCTSVGAGPQEVDEEPASGDTKAARTSYRISIATALIDQRSNQLRLSTPRIIVSKRAGCSEPNTHSGPQEPVESPVTMSVVSATPPELEEVRPAEGQDELVAAKVTSISIGSPLQSPSDTISNLKKLLPALLPDQNNNNNNNNDDDDHGDSQAVTASEDSMERRMEKIMREEKEAGEEQLTCNLSLGDAIQITSTSIRIAAHVPPMTCVTGGPPALLSSTTTPDNTSVVPIGTPARGRRRDERATLRLSRQAIHEDEGDGASDQVGPCSTDRAMFFGPDSGSRDGEQTASNNSSLGDQEALEYSPILSSVRDYIKNVNTELQVQTSAPGAQLPAVAAAAEATATLLVTPFTLSPHGELLASSSLLASASANQLEVASACGPAAGNLCAIATPESSGESPKKSIFEGASKDEILEYLEDARERVPEILMAADDVMVIGDNELIVVNQLEPNSPATPISIVETVEAVLGGSASQSQPPEAPLVGDLELNEARQEDVAGQPDRLRQHLQQMYQQSRLRGGYPSGGSTSVDNNTTDDEMAALALGTFDGSLDEAGSASTNHMETIAPSEPASSETTTTSKEMQQQQQSSQLQLNFATSASLLFANGRRNSASSEGAKGDMSGGGGGGPGTASQSRLAAAMQLMRQHHQRYPNQRDSLSSPSSSPPSSTSPSSTGSSSQQTSGNCSAASTFYASSSLSCSSPLLAALGVPSPPLEPARAQQSPSVVATSPASELAARNGQQVERGDSGLGSADFAGTKAAYLATTQSGDADPQEGETNNKVLSVIEETKPAPTTATSSQNSSSSLARPAARKKAPEASGNNLVTRSLHGHYATINRLNHYFMNRHPFSNTSETTVEFQCLDCDQFIDVDQAIMMNKSNELRMLRSAASMELESSTSDNNSGKDSSTAESARKESLMTADQLDRAYIAAMNGLPLCKSCEKKRVERKEIISEFVETELKYGRDLKIIHDEFYRPMQIAGLLSKDHICAVFLNLEELIMAHCKFADCLQTAIRGAQAMGDADYNTLNIGRLFIESSEMLTSFESYCIRQGSAACLLARLAKEKELLRVFLRVSQMENTLLRRMNLAAFLMVPVQRVTKYPLLLNRLYKVTAYHHKDREQLRDAQLKVELHLEHINQQTKGLGATNKIWRRISNLSTPISSSRRGLINAEDIGYIKLRKTAMDMLKWDRDETQFIHSGKLNFAPLNEFLTKQKMKPIRYMAAHALLIVLGKPNWKYRPDLVKSNLDSKLMTPTPGGNGIREAALLLFREKNGRFIPCREPLFLKNCVLSADCSQFNSECPLNQPLHGAANSSATTTTANAAAAANTSNQTGSNKEPASGTKSKVAEFVGERKSNSSTGADTVSVASVKSLPEERSTGASAAASSSSSPPPPPPPPPTSRSNSLASALPRALPAALATPATTATAASSTCSLNQANKSSVNSQPTIINQLMTKVNQSYQSHKQHQNSPQQQQPHSNSKFSIVSPEPVTPMNQSRSFSVVSIAPSSSHADLRLANQNPLAHTNAANIATSAANIEAINRRSSTTATCGIGSSSGVGNNGADIHQHYNHLFFHNHHQPYGDYEESFELHEVLTKESLLLRADTPLKTRYWLQMLRYHAKDLGQWRGRRNGLANIMMMRQE